MRKDESNEREKDARQNVEYTMELLDIGSGKNDAYDIKLKSINNVY